MIFPLEWHEKLKKDNKRMEETDFLKWERELKLKEHHFDGINLDVHVQEDNDDAS